MPRLSVGVRGYTSVCLPWSFDNNPVVPLFPIRSQQSGARAQEASHWTNTRRQSYLRDAGHKWSSQQETNAGPRGGFPPCWSWECEWNLAFAPKLAAVKAQRTSGCSAHALSMRRACFVEINSAQAKIMDSFGKTPSGLGCKVRSHDLNFIRQELLSSVAPFGQTRKLSQSRI